MGDVVNVIYSAIVGIVCLVYKVSWVKFVEEVLFCDFIVEVKCW